MLLIHRRKESGLPRGSTRGDHGHWAYRAILVALCLGVATGAVPAASLAKHTAQHRYLTEQKNRLDIPTYYEPLTFEEFLALPAIPEKYTAPDWDIVRTQTQRGVSLEGYIAEVIRANDGASYGRPPEQGDLHVHLQATRQRECGRSRPRNQQIVTEVTPHFQPPPIGWSYEAMLDLCQRQARVRISGWLLHDFKNIKNVGKWRVSAWEIHPVTWIELWDTGRSEWQNFPPMKTSPSRPDNRMMDQRSTP